MNQNQHFLLTQIAPEELEAMEQNTLIWRLNRYNGKGTRHRSVKAPDPQLEDKMTSTWFEEGLNAAHPFDFEFVPQVGDELIVYFQPLQSHDAPGYSPPERMYFLFWKDVWQRDKRLGGYHQHRVYSQGKVVFHNGIPKEAAPAPPETVEGMLQRIVGRGAILHLFVLDKSSLPAPELLNPTDVIWKISRYKGRSLNPDHGRGLTEVEARELSGPSLDLLDGGWDVEWVQLQLEERNCFGFDYVPKQADSLRIIVGYGTPQAAHLAFNYNDGWYPQPHAVFSEWKRSQDPGFADWYQQRQREAYSDKPDPRVIRDVIHEGRVVIDAENPDDRRHV